MKMCPFAFSDPNSIQRCIKEECELYDNKSLCCYIKSIELDLADLLLKHMN